MVGERATTGIGGPARSRLLFGLEPRYFSIKTAQFRFWLPRVKTRVEVEGVAVALGGAVDAAALPSHSTRVQLHGHFIGTFAGVVLAVQGPEGRLSRRLSAVTDILQSTSCCTRSHGMRMQ